ncbi:MAG TPA: WD40 repeat domain-containing protein [Anaerolineae bacterium]|nr:WD40 repeat domain-containing protein [Anaerolineae bacterium]HQI86006.1 WD40 repeat domain-containing protein [Anaerolineae bacterium]
MKNNPYVGPRPYERGDAYKFYGRNREARDLLALLLAERVVLFYAKSGAGKTSLLNAQVIPALEKEGVRVLPVARVSSDVPPGIAPDTVGNVFVFSVLMALAGANASPAQLRTATLATILQALYKRPDSDSEGDAPFLLIVDQFEELFITHRDRWQDAEGFFIQMRDALEALPGMGVLFAMREDYLAELDTYVALLPKRLRARFRMELLGPEGALEAIIRPAQDQDIRFDEGVAERMVDDLRRIRVQQHTSSGAEEEATTIGPFVEPVQLQVVCSRLWENLPEQEDHAIQWAEVEEHGRIDQALIDFYRSALDAAQKQTGVSQKQVRRWFGNELITPMQTRGLVLRGPETTGTLPNAAVDVLSSHYIIRSEVRAGARWYELSHDRLIAPILSSNQKWEAKRSTPLRITAKSWQATKEASLLYRGAALDEALRWAEAHPLDAEPYEREFLTASRQAQQMQRRRRAIQITIIALSVITFALITFLGIDAERNRLLADSQEAAAAALYYYQAGDQINSILFAREGVLIGNPDYRDANTPLWRPLLGQVDTRQAQNALRQTVVDFYPAQVIAGLPENPYSIVYSADGQYLYAGIASGQLRTWLAQGDWLRQTATYETRGATWSLALSPDGRILAAGGDNVAAEDGTVGLFDVTGRRWLNWLEVPTSADIHDDVYAVAFSADGYYLATGGDYDAKWRDYTDGSAPGIVRVWELGTRGDALLATAVLTLTGPTARVTSVAFDPRPLRNVARVIYEPYFLAVASKDGAVRIWALSPAAPGSLSATLALTLTGHTDAVNAVAYSPAENVLASASADKTIRIWDPRTGKALLTLVGHSAEVTSLAFSADGRYLISGSRDLTVRVWDVMARNPNALLTLLSGPQNVVLAVAFSPDNRFLVAGTADHALRAWNQGFVARQGLTTLSGHRARVRGVAYSPDGQHLASSDDEGRVRIWNVWTGETTRELAAVGGRIWNLAYSPDGQYLVTCAADGNAYVWDQTAGAPAFVLRGHTRDVNAAGFSGDGRYLLTGSDDQTAILWDTATWSAVAELTIPGRPRPGPVYSAAYSPDGQWAATGYSSGDVTLWSVTTDDAGPVQVAPVVTFTEHMGYVMGLAFSLDSNYLASAAWDGTVRLWSVETLTTAVEMPLHHPNDVYVYSVAFSPADAEGYDYLATGARDGRVRLWRLANFPAQPPELVAELRGHTDLVWSIAFSPDGKYVASGSWDRTIRRYLVPFADVWALAEDYIAGVPEEQIMSMEEQQ